MFPFILCGDAQIQCVFAHLRLPVVHIYSVFMIVAGFTLVALISSFSFITVVFKDL